MQPVMNPKYPGLSVRVADEAGGTALPTCDAIFLGRLRAAAGYEVRERRLPGDEGGAVFMRQQFGQRGVAFLQLIQCSDRSASAQTRP